MKNRKFAVTLALLVVVALCACLGLVACGQEHTHTYDENAWVNTDPAGHYHAYTCEHEGHTDVIAHNDGNGDYKCDTCGYVMHTHTYNENDWVNTDASGHYHAYTCNHDGHTDAVAHSDNDGDYACDVCGYVMHAHTFNEAVWVNTDAIGHYHPATCEHSDIHSEAIAHEDKDNDLACDTCGYVMHTHTYNEAVWVNTDPAGHYHAYTCNHEGHTTAVAHEDKNNDLACDVCGYVMHVHTASEEWTSVEEGHYHAYTCGHEGHTEVVPHADENNDFACDVCGYILHTHTFNPSVWVNTDPAGHYHEYNCKHEGHTEVVPHEDENNDFACDVCGYVMHVHTASEEWTSVEEGHYHVYTCGHVGHTEVVPHEDENNDELCDVCGYDMHVHTYDENAWVNTDPEGHYHTYTCGHEGHTEVVDHVDSDNDNTCDVCGWSSVGYVQVVFNMNGKAGTAPKTQNIVEGATATAPAAPTTDGYTFVAWYTEAACTTAYDFEAAVNEDITLYAKWAINPATVTSLVSGGVYSKNGAFDQVVFGENVSIVWHPADESIGRDVDGYWVGVKVVAPAGVDISNGYYYDYYAEGRPHLSIAETLDGENYKEMWGRVLEDDVANPTVHPMGYYCWMFDWDNDGKIDTSILIIIDHANITLVPKKNPSLTIDESATVNVGETATIQSTVVDVEGDIVWTSGDEAIATVANGVVTGVAKGQVTITATIGGLTKTCTVTVKAPSITLDQATASAEIGETINLVATVVDIEGDIVWSSGDEAVATVANGVVTGVAAGQATITAAIGGKSATCVVTITAPDTRDVYTGEYIIGEDKVADFTDKAAFPNKGSKDLTVDDFASFGLDWLEMVSGKVRVQTYLGLYGGNSGELGAVLRFTTTVDNATFVIRFNSTTAKRYFVIKDSDGNPVGEGDVANAQESLPIAYEPNKIGSNKDIKVVLDEAGTYTLECYAFDGNGKEFRIDKIALIESSSATAVAADNIRIDSMSALLVEDAFVAGTPLTSVSSIIKSISLRLQLADGTYVRGVDYDAANIVLSMADESTALKVGANAITVTYGQVSCIVNVDAAARITVTLMTKSAVADEYSAEAENISALNGQKIAQPTSAACPTGYTIEGWYTEATCENKFAFTQALDVEIAEGAISGTLILYAKYVAEGEAPTARTQQLSFSAAENVAKDQTLTPDDAVLFTAKMTGSASAVTQDKSTATANNESGLTFDYGVLPSGSSGTYTITAKVAIRVTVYYTTSDGKFSTNDQEKKGDLQWKIGDNAQQTSTTGGNKSNKTAYAETIELAAGDVLVLSASSNRLVLFGISAEEIL